MKPEEQRRALAKLSGWNPDPSKTPTGLVYGAAAGFPHWYFTHELPDYLGDLNEVAKLEARLTDEQFREFDERLANTCEFIHPHRRQRHVVSGATAQHRCEALLRTLGLWREAK